MASAILPVEFFEELKALLPQEKGVGPLGTGRGWGMGRR